MSKHWKQHQYEIAEIQFVVRWEHIVSLIIDGVQVPPRWAGKGKPCMVAPISYGRHAECINLALINNMPDSALEDTEMQFFELLDIASGNLPVYIKLYSLPKVPRGDRGEQHLNNFYSSTNDLWDDQIDAVIMTGTEPRCPNLCEEPYWGTLTEVLDWAENNTVSIVLSCLAAHAAVLHCDGIARHPLTDKQFGVFESVKLHDHDLTNHLAAQIRFPHSRWNELREDEIASCGYSVLTRSDQAGVDLFVKKKKNSLFIGFQGHPEYGAQTLLKEYRRDIKRFLRSERKTYPSMPQGYFDAAATRLFSDFQQKVFSNPQKEQLAAALPDLWEMLRNSWQSSAVCIYRNWLQYVLSKKREMSTFAVTAPARRAISSANNEIVR